MLEGSTSVQNRHVQEHCTCAPSWKYQGLLEEECLCSVRWQTGSGEGGRGLLCMQAYYSQGCACESVLASACPFKPVHASLRLQAYALLLCSIRKVACVLTSRCLCPPAHWNQTAQTALNACTLWQPVQLAMGISCLESVDRGSEVSL